MFDSLQASSELPFDVHPSFEFHDDIHRSVVPVYSRRQAIADGMLVDVSPLARDHGFKDAVALTRRVYADCIADSRADSSDDAENTQLLNVLMSATWALRAQAHRRLREIEFAVHPASADDHEQPFELKIIAGPGDRGETVLTILSVDED